MKINTFKTEQWMTKYENDAKYNLTDTCISYLSLDELLSFDTNNKINDILLTYGEIEGNKLVRKEILKLYQKGTIDNIITSTGCLKANESVMMALLNRNDYVLTFTPSYQQFIDLPKSLGCKVITIKLHEDNNWLLDYSDIEKAFSEYNIKMVIINNPNNPTGTYFNETLLKKIIKLAKPNKTYILVDEVYRGLDYKNEISISDIYEYGISTSSLSKTYSLAGLRFGWIKANKQIIDKLLILRDYSFISTGPLIDYLGLIALKNKNKILKRNNKIVSENKKIISNWLKQNDKFELVLPEYGSVCFIKYKVSICTKLVISDILTHKVL